MKFSEIDSSLGASPIPFQRFDLSEPEIKFSDVPKENAAHNLLVLLENLPVAQRCKLNFKVLIDGSEVGEYTGGLTCSLLFGDAQEISVPRFDALKIQVNTEIDYDIDAAAYIVSLEQQVLALRNKPELTKEIENAMVGMLAWTEGAKVAQDLSPSDQLVEMSQKDNPFSIIESMAPKLAIMATQLEVAQAAATAQAQATTAAQVLTAVQVQAPVPQTAAPQAAPLIALQAPGIFQTGPIQLPAPILGANQLPQVENLYTQMLAEGGQAMCGVGTGNGEIRIRDMKDYLASLKVTKEESKSACIALYQVADNDTWKAAICLVSKTCADAPSWTSDTLYIAINSARNTCKSISFSAVVQEFAHAVFKNRGEVCTATFQPG